MKLRKVILQTLIKVFAILGGKMKISKVIKYIFLTVLIIFIVPIIINIIISMVPIIFVENITSNNWLTFWGNYLGGVVGGSFIFIVLRVTIKNESNLLKYKMELQYRPYLQLIKNNHVNKSSIGIGDIKIIEIFLRGNKYEVEAPNVTSVSLNKTRNETIVSIEHIRGDIARINNLKLIVNGRIINECYKLDLVMKENTKYLIFRTYYFSSNTNLKAIISYIDIFGNIFEEEIDFFAP